MQGVLADIGDAQMCPCEFPHCFLPVGTSPLTPGNDALQALDPVQALGEGAWVLHPCSIAHDGQCQYPQIHPCHGSGGFHWFWDAHLNLYRHEPASGTFTHRGAQDVSTLYWQVAVLFQAQTSQAG